MYQIVRSYLHKFSTPTLVFIVDYPMPPAFRRVRFTKTLEGFSPPVNSDIVADYLDWVNDT